MQRGARFALVAAVLLFAAGEAGAQFGGGGFPGGGSRRGGMRGGGAGDSDKSTQRPAQGEARPALFQVTLEELRVDLKLDAAQQAAWNAYAEKLAALMSDLARERSRARPGVASTVLTAPQQLDLMVMSAQNRATAIEEATGAAKTLYAALSAEQKSVADVRLANLLSIVLATPSESAAGRARGK